MPLAQQALTEQEVLRELQHGLQKRRVCGKALHNAGKIALAKALAVSREKSTNLFAGCALIDQGQID
jgi:hypothetical protein